MSGFSTAGGVINTESFLSLIMLLSDPKATSARLLELQKAETDAQTRIEQAAVREKNANEALSAANKQREELSRTIAQHDRDAQQFRTLRDETNNAQLARGGELDRREQAIAKREQEFERQQAAKRGELERREADVKNREDKASEKETALSRLGSNLENKRRQFEAALAPLAAQ